MKINFDKYHDGLIPTIIQDHKTLNVLMLGFMNENALKKTIESKKVTFFSRSKNRLWTKGEESGHFLNLINLKIDCDNDTLLIKAEPEGPTCHKGWDTCWDEENKSHKNNFISELESLIKDRISNPNTPPSSYIKNLHHKGINAIAQKVGEEAVELIIEAKDSNHSLFLNEAADLLFHYLILLNAKNFSLDDVINVLHRRNQKKE